MSICDIAGVPAEQCANNITSSPDQMAQVGLFIWLLVIAAMTFWADRLKERKQ